MLRTVVLIASLVVVAACGGKATPAPQPAREVSTAEPKATGPAPAPAGDHGDEMIAKMRDYKTQVCACADAACVEDAEKALMEWAMAHMDELKEFKPSKEQDAEADRLEEAIDTCRAKVATSSSSSSSSATSAEILAGMASFKDRICACRDKACLEKTETEMTEWAMSKLEIIKNLTPTKAEDEAADKIQAEMEACQARINGKP